MNVIFCFLVCLAAATADRPVIGILSQPLSDPSFHASSYIAASYIKYAEVGGARVVPIIWDEPSASLLQKLSGVNAVLLPGGGADMGDNPYGRVLKVIWNEMVAAYANNERWPIWGTCLGFEEVAWMASGYNLKVLTSVNAENISLPLDFLPAAKGSVLFASASAEEMSILANQPVTMNNHMYGVTPANFDAFLPKTMVALATSTDRDGVVFVSAMEGIEYPVYATQFHPEKSAFEWNPNEVIPHTEDAIKANGYFGRFLGNQSRGNMRGMTEDAFSKVGIYNYQPVYSFSRMSSFEQIYVFNATS